MLLMLPLKTGSTRKANNKKYIFFETIMSALFSARGYFSINIFFLPLCSLIVRCVSKAKTIGQLALDQFAFMLRFSWILTAVGMWEREGEREMCNNIWFTSCCSFLESSTMPRYAIGALSREIDSRLNEVFREDSTTMMIVSLSLVLWGLTYFNCFLMKRFFTSKTVSLIVKSVEMETRYEANHIRSARQKDDSEKCEKWRLI